MAKGYWIASVDVSDFEDYKNYIAENQNAFRKHGARYVTRGGKSEVVEGKGRSRSLSSSSRTTLPHLNAIVRLNTPRHLPSERTTLSLTS